MRLTLYQSMKPLDDEKLMCMRVDTMSWSIDEHMDYFTKNDSMERCLASLLFERELDKKKKKRFHLFQRWLKPYWRGWRAREQPLW